MSQGTREQLNFPQRQILDSMVWLESRRIPMPWSRQLLAFTAGYKPNSGHYKKQCALLRESGRISYPGRGLVALEQEGRELAKQPAAELTLEHLQSNIHKHLHPVESRLYAILVEIYPNHIERQSAAARASIEWRRFGQALSTLTIFGLVELEVAHIRAAAVMFPVQLQPAIVDQDGDGISGSDLLPGDEHAHHERN